MVHPHDLFDNSEPWTVRIKSLAREFSKRGHKIRLCYFPLELKNFSVNSENSIDFIQLDRTFSPRVFVKNIRRLIELSRWADVVHFQKSHHYAAVPSVIAAFVNKKPLHYDWDDWEEKIFYDSCKPSFNAFIIGSLFNILEKTLPNLADTVSVASSSLKNLVLGFGKKDDNIYLAPVGADLDKFRPDIDGSKVRSKFGIKGPLVLYVGQLHGAQYVQLLIQAAKIVLSSEPGARFVVVGEGFKKEGLESFVRELGLTGKIIFTGAVSHDEVPVYIAASDICVAVFEDTPLVRCKSPLKIVEYMASGKPVVASDVGEVTKMVGDAGRIIPAGDMQSLAKEILSLIRDEPLRTEIGRRARKRAELNCSWSTAAENILSAYERIV